MTNLKLYEAVTRVVEDPDDAVQLIREIEGMGFRIIERPTVKNKMLGRVGRLVTQQVNLSAKLKEYKRTGTVFGAKVRASTIVVWTAQESAVRHICQDYGVDFGNHVQVLHYLKHGMVGDNDSAYNRYMEAHPDAETGWTTT